MQLSDRTLVALGLTFGDCHISLFSTDLLPSMRLHHSVPPVQYIDIMEGIVRADGCLVVEVAQ